MSKILTVIHDPGGTKAISAVITKLMSNSNNQCLVYAGKFATSWLKELGIPYHDISTNIVENDADRIISEFQPNILFTGTSWDSNVEQVFRNIAYKKNITSFTFFDYWMNYASRFIGADYPITATKDWIGVADDEMAREVHSEGFPKNQILPLGHPHFDFLSQNRKKFIQAEKKVGKYNAIFISENYPEAYLRSLGKHPILSIAESYSQFLAEENIQSAIFDLKLHPKEGASEMLNEALVELARLPRLKLNILNQNLTLLNHLSQYEYAFGYQSMGLFEAKALGLKTMALPLLKGDRYPSLFKAMDHCKIIYVRPHLREIREGIRKLAEQNSSAEEFQPFRGAIERMAKKIETLAISG